MDFLDLYRNLTFCYINGPHSKFVQIDMVLTFNFRQGLPRKCLYNVMSLENHPIVGAAPTLGGL